MTQEKVEELQEEDDDELWEDCAFIESVSEEGMKEKEKTIHKKHDEDMNFNCKECNKKISAHNKDWHNRMCDKCFDNFLGR